MKKFTRMIRDFEESFVITRSRGKLMRRLNSH